MKSRTKSIGILTSGGDCPGLNAAIRGVAKAAMHYGIQVLGVQDGFRGLVENRVIPLDALSVSGLLVAGGTLLGTSRDKPHKMRMGQEVMDMTEVAVTNMRRMNIDCLVCLGGNGTQKNALRIRNAADDIGVITLPKTIDNDVVGTDVTFGFDSAMRIATEAVDRLHTTATSHHRIIVCEIMGHEAGWLALGSGIAGGADVILIPEVPYDLEVVAQHLINRRKGGKRFSIIAVAEGVRSREEAALAAAEAEPGSGKKKKKNEQVFDALSQEGVHLVQEPVASKIARHLQTLTGVEARVTSLGHVQRGGQPTAYDRLLATRLGTKAGTLLANGVYDVMVAVQGDQTVPVPLREVAGQKRTVPLDHPWLEAARLVDTCLGDTV
jgi:ATP-dependent phosphofructokinase / diphosphate-dependent phosphofructokinase